MVIGSIYRLSTGMVTLTCNGPDEDFLHLQTNGDPDLGVYVGELDMKTHYLPGGVPTERPVMELEIKVGGNVMPDFDVMMTTTEILEISGIPEGSRVWHPAGVDDVDDGFIEWESAQPMKAMFMIICHPFQEVTINAEVA